MPELLLIIFAWPSQFLLPVYMDSMSSDLRGQELDDFQDCHPSSVYLMPVPLRLLDIDIDSGRPTCPPSNKYEKLPTNTAMSSFKLKDLRGACADM